MAQVPYDHIEAPRALTLNGVLAFQEGDAVPLETARREGWVTEDTEVIRGTGSASSAEFVDAEIKAPEGGTDTAPGETPPGDPAGAAPAPATPAGHTGEAHTAGTDTGKKGR